jgi:pyrroloquinoline quinone biosynthesis protein B
VAVEAILLGNAQDGGLPQAGCPCDNCRRAWADPAQRRGPACLGLVDTTAGQSWLIDATPDLPAQLHALAEAAPARLAGILLTHAHTGHYAGLIHLGREAWATRRLPLYASARMAAFLAANAPWSALIDLGHVEVRPLAAGQPLRLSPRLAVTPRAVPHRDEYSDTLAFHIEGPARRLLYCPDTDAWDRWDRDVREIVTGVDVALLDGTFFSAGELPGRDLAEIPHPLAADTATRLAGVDCDVRLIHLNHSNPLHRPGPARDWLAARGLGVGLPGDRWRLGD